ncbi:hypothetical protein BMS3Bbin07_00547 [bacterium BMS3Bbin07]|nr:hypothetical protein BMS3Bbin07_00547 [bacterium BMS3Bbin07]
MGSFSILYLCRVSFASSRVILSVAVMSLSFVITSLTFLSIRVSNLRSLFVRIPISLPFTVTGTPDILYRVIKAKASLIGASGETVIGSIIIPLSDFLTLSTSRPCLSGDIALCMNPMPPSLAMAMAMEASVTVSIAAVTMGVFKLILRVRYVVTSTSFGITSDFAGMRRTSSKVRPVRTFSSTIYTS